MEVPPGCPRGTPLAESMFGETQSGAVCRTHGKPHARSVSPTHDAPTRGTIGGYERDEAEGASPVTAADRQAIAEWVTAATVLTGAISWVWNRTRPLGILFAGRLR